MEIQFDILDKFKNKSKLKKLSFNLKNIIINFLDVRDKYILYKMPEFFSTFKRLEINVFYRDLLSQFENKLPSKFLDITQLLSEEFINSNLNKIYTKYSKQTIYFCLGLVLSKILILNNVSLFYIQTTLNCKKLFYLSLIVSCCEKFHSIKIEIKNELKSVRKLGPSHIEAFRQLFYNLKNNSHFKIITISLNSNFMTYDRNTGSLMVNGVDSILFYHIYNCMVFNLGPVIKKLHINLWSSSVLNNNLNLFYFLDSKKSHLVLDNELTEFNPVETHIEYLSLNIPGVKSKYLKSNPNFFKNLINYDKIINTIYFSSSIYDHSQILCEFLENVKVHQINLNVPRFFETENFLCFMSNKFKKFILNCPYIDLNFLTKSLNNHQFIAEFTLGKLMRSSEYLTFFKNLKLKNKLIAINIQGFINNENNEILFAFKNFLESQESLKIFNLIDSRLSINEKKEILTHAEKFGIKVNF
jgi:hypothetical protein